MDAFNISNTSVLTLDIFIAQQEKAPTARDKGDFVPWEKSTNKI